MMNTKLIFLCGKMAAGKTTLAKELARDCQAILLVQDEFLTHLYPVEISDIPTFVKYSTRLRESLEGHIHALLSRGISVVLDFPANTTTQRLWFRRLFERAGVEHELHFINVPDGLCKDQLKQRSASLPVGSPFTTDAEFDALTSYFRPPARDEGFNVIEHKRAEQHAQPRPPTG
jgi:predicted kinase